jgi:hypothetical protein
VRITAALPGRAPVPRRLGGFDTGDWIVLVLENVAGRHPALPGSDADIAAVRAGIDELVAAFTPAPPIDVPRASDVLAGNFADWDRIGADPPADLDPWARDHLPAIASGATLTHGASRPSGRSSAPRATRCCPGCGSAAQHC